LLFCYLIKGVNINSQKFKTLAFKIQAILVLIVFSSLLAFGWGSGVFVRNQYNKYTAENIREKLESLELELRAKLGKKESLSIEEQGNYMGIVLSKLSRVFITDINLYDPSGHLLSSSQPKVFNCGLMSEQINANAFYMLGSEQKSDFSQQEIIGDLKYISAYLPFYNSNGKLLAYVNLQHFGQQQDLETQIQKFLVSIINVFILLLVISIIISVIVSNWVTKPLRLLQNNISNIQFGLGNQKITYHKDDEIGNLAQQYNQKLEELADTAEQLAKSERESAWRDMAKQVAHEIKNPLTPMKLSIQQLIRVFEKSDTESYKKLERVTTSLIEQIDGLTKIANEFSNFAKMPLPENEKLNLVDLLKNVISLFNQENNIEISFSADQDPSFIFADKDQIIRVFNNLIKNAIQAISINDDGVISIKVVKEGSFYRVSIEDNGFGIASDQKDKIFVPYFTTKTTGTGIGLPIAKQIIENHNGDISFTSLKESGTVFTVILPIYS
jgi:signal transduction histidine kinase